MEKISRYRKIIIIISSILFIAGGALLYYKLFFNSFSNINPSQAKIYKLKVDYFDINGNNYKLDSQLNLNKILPKGVYASCNPKFTLIDPILYGYLTDLTELPKSLNPEVTCPDYAVLSVARTIPSASVYINDGKKILEWIYENKDFQKIQQTEVYKGFVINYRHIFNITGKEVGIKDIATPFMNLVMDDIIKSNPIIHYDTVRGRNGIVFEFNSNKANFAKNMLVVLINNQAKYGYSFENYNNKIWELIFGNQKVFITSNNNQMYLSYNLISLINTIEIPKESLVLKKIQKGSLTVTVRAESYFDSLIKKIIGKDNFHASFGFNLDKDNSSPSEALFDNQEFFQVLSPKISDGVLKSIPYDVFFSMIASISLPNPVNTDKVFLDDEKINLDFLKLRKKSSGIGLIWDLNPNKLNNISDIGLVISNNIVNKNDGIPIDKMFDAEKIILCKPGNVYLIASSDLLLEKMNKSCNSQNKSILSWKDQITNKFTNNQLLLFLNLKKLFESSFLSGDMSSVFDRDENRNIEINSFITYIRVFWKFKWYRK